MADHTTVPAPRGDEAELFRSYNRELVRSIAAAVESPSSDVIEDACSFAWAQFMRHQPDRDRDWRSWMFTTAQREAWKLSRQLIGREQLTLTDGDGGFD